MSHSGLLTSFTAWASTHQQRLLDSASPYVTTLQIGKATNNRAATFTIERFKVEPTGWIGSELEQGGVLTVWENGCADAEWADADDLSGDKPAPSYQEHWDSLDSNDFTSAFARFTNKFEGF